jgi:osomolarity two-component system sensor histidine kinase TcsA
MAAPLGSRPAPPSTPPSSAVDRSSPRSRDDSLPLDFFRFTPIPTVILDPLLVIRQVSDSYLEILGGCVLGHADQSLGLHADEFFAQRVLFPSYGSVRKVVQAVQETKRPHELVDVHSDGSVWKIRLVPIFRHDILRYLQMELIDITEEHRKQLDLEERLYTNETFRILVETVKDYAIFMLDPQGNVATWNAGAQVGNTDMNLKIR